MPEEIKPDKGTMLIAQPFMSDPNFKRSVILLCDHHKKEGTVGFIVNKKTDLLINDLVDDFPEIESKVFFGGPVAQETLHYIHTVGAILDESIEISQGVYWGGNFEKLKFLIDSKLILPKDIRFYVGYSGWTEGQLDNEIKHGSWITSEFFPNYVFGVNNNLLWSKILSNKGDRFSVIGQIPGGQTHN